MSTDHHGYRRGLVAAGKREDTLRRHGGRWKLARWTILLDQNVLLPRHQSMLF